MQECDRHAGKKFLGCVFAKKLKKISDFKDQLITSDESRGSEREASEGK